MARTGRRPTMADVAAKAGVSVSTVSLAYSGAAPVTEETLAKVKAAAAALDYAGPSAQARALRSGRTGIVAVVVHERLVRTLRDPLQLRILDAIVEDLGAMGVGVLLLPSPDSGDSDSALLATAAMDAAVVLRVRDHDEPALEVLRRRGIPAVVMEAPDGALSGAHITIDDTAATEELVRRLVDAGHTRIATVTVPMTDHARTRLLEPADLPDPMWTAPRHRLDAFARVGIEPCAIVEAEASMVEEGMTAGRLLLEHPSKPTAVVCHSDLLAGGVIVAAREAGLEVPRDLSVTGFDGLDLPWLAPLTLTTQAQDGTAKGHAIASAVRALLDGDEPGEIPIALELREGTTVAPAP
ncbi:LacI family DNA-binding transcriptional regulator [Demequina zhanjiangensis]|uniref:LacI family DNA-binding transcriptional regulator n=1 Tax=Demequina zhanjiangensis TaxID=3051659 RepID=A0ABT8FXP8_9MICO|nr:LacI family DNA-binding transcriptional regulator [Demequina sp. SYSU T00b26]MDN4471459.1 LacI family DNA-binding transcriptional regulator [Demequina sp. SYSU T00b26]